MGSVTRSTIPTAADSETHVHGTRPPRQLRVRHLVFRGVLSVRLTMVVRTAEIEERKTDENERNDSARRTAALGTFVLRQWLQSRSFQGGAFAEGRDSPPARFRSARAPNARGSTCPWSEQEDRNSPKRPNQEQ